MITSVWLQPPLAFARLGPSPTPCDAYQWGPDDVHPRGSGKTAIVPAETLHVADDGTVTSEVPDTVRFKDEAGFRPVCPFFEVHAAWTDGAESGSGPLTPALLARFGIALADVRWTVRAANLKAHHYTGMPGDRVEATVELAGDATDRQPLLGTSPDGDGAPLVPPGASVPLGSVQLTKPTGDFPELRLRFTPPAGLVYGPTDLAARLRSVVSRYPRGQRVRHWEHFSLPAERLVLNPAAAWCSFDPLAAGDFRTNPSLLYAWEDVDNAAPVSLGLVDDVSDAVVSCRLPDGQVARGRVVVAPPDFAPDRRPFTSLADGLKDRVDRDDVLDPAYTEDVELTSAEVRDLLERVAETVGLSNLDFQNERSGRENQAAAGALHRSGRAGRELRPFGGSDLVGQDQLPLTARARQRHRRFVSIELLEDVFRQHPTLLDAVVREPLASSPLYDARMPAMMRGSDGLPMHLTRRQHALLQAWVARLRRGVEEGQ